MRKLLLLIVLLLLAGAGGLGWLAHFSEQPLALPKTPYPFTVQQGSGLKQVARELTDGGLLPEPWSFVWMARLLGKTAQIKAGDYELTQALTPMQLLARLARGEVKQLSITFIEGQTFAQMRAILDQHADLKHDTAGLSDAQILNLVGAEESSVEGIFFPDTYSFTRGFSDVELLKRAYRTLREHLDKAWQARAKSLPLASPYEALILASVVEKETGKASERADIAAVFVNRLTKRMRLQTDPTVIYGLGASFDGNLTRKHLQTDHPYNTYTREGLPPTPICMVSRDAILAAVNPSSSGAFYFVSRGDGSHEFSSTLAEHNRAVVKYQK